MNNGTTALMVACQNGHLEVVSLLLASGADKDLANHGGETARVVASQNGHLEVAGLLLGAEKDLASNNGDSIFPSV